MLAYGKSTQIAIAAMSLLAQRYDAGQTRLSATDIAAERNLPKPFVAKLLVMLANAGLVKGSPGPGGGYALARPPHEISFLDVATIFERLDEASICPFGPHWCGHHDPCPLHLEFLSLTQTLTSFLRRTTFSIFTPTPATATL